MCFYAGMNLKDDFSKYHLAPEEVPAFKEYLTPANLAWAIIQRRPISELVEEFHDHQKYLARKDTPEAQAAAAKAKIVWNRREATVS